MPLLITITQWADTEERPSDIQVGDAREDECIIVRILFMIHVMFKLQGYFIHPPGLMEATGANT